MSRERCYGQDTPWQHAGCCGASSKETCAQPPCPCNLEAWTPQELTDLAAERRKTFENEAETL